MYRPSFEEWLIREERDAPAHLVEPDRTHCTGCLKKAKLSRHGYCRECLRYSFGYDEAERAMLDALVGGAVRGALAAYVSPELIQEAVTAAIREDYEERDDALLERYGKALARQGRDDER